MSKVAEFYRWWIVDAVTGERVLTPYKLTSAHAALAFPGAEPDLQTRELRDLPDFSQDPWGNTRPGEPWEDSKPVDPGADNKPQPSTAAKAFGIGDSVTLPSGLVVTMTSQALRQRPWAAVGSGSVWHVCGKPGRGDDGEVPFFFVRMRRTPLQLEEADARALAKILNAVRWRSS
jgi:hypothetical protein